MSFSVFTTPRTRFARGIAGQAACWMFALSAASAWAQAPAAPGPQPDGQVPTLSVKSEEVSLDLVVRDHGNNPVLDLKPDEIAVTDDGVPVKISNLRLIQGDGSGRKVTLLFGRLDEPGDKNARNAAAKILGVMPGGTSIAVMNVGSRMRLLQPFTNDRGAVERAVNQATVQDQLGVPGNNEAPEKNLLAVAETGADAAGLAVPVADRVMAKVLLAGLQESQRIVQDQYCQATLGSLLALARTQKEIPGRKIVVYFTEGFQMDANAIDMVHNIVGAANRSGVTIYVIDLSALDYHAADEMLATVGMGAAGPGYRAQANSTGPKTEAAGRADNAAFSVHDAPGELRQNAETNGRLEVDGSADTSSPLGSLTAGTSGGYISAGDSMKKPLKRLVEDMTNYYQASFVPAIKDYDGSFRPVHVASLRKGIFLRYRAGYFAIAPGSDSAVRPFESPMLTALSGQDLPSDVKFHAAVLRMGKLTDGNANTVVVEAPLDGLEVREDSNTKLYSLHVSLVAQVKNEAGAVIEHFAEDVPQHGAIEALQEPGAEVITLQRHFVAPPGKYFLEAAVLDQNSNKLGAQRIPFEVPAAQDGLSMSDMALVRRTDPLHADGETVEPLRYQAGKIVPNLSGEIPKQTKDISVFFIIHPDQHATDPVKLDMEVRKDGKSIGRFPLPMRDGVGPGVAVPFFSTIQARSLSAGHYEVAAILSQGGKSTEQTTSFTITGPDLASADLTSGAPGRGNKGDSDQDTVSDSQLPGIVGRESSKLAITAPATAVPPPTAEQIATIIASARQRALTYSDSLPNFSCVEITNRSTDPSGKGPLKHKDSITQLLRYRDHDESRMTLEVDGRKASEAPDDMKSMTSRGEFGGVLKAVFDPERQAAFEWKETDAIGNATVQVFTYKVAQPNSYYRLTTRDNNQISVAYAGEVYIDAATRAVRRVTLQAQDIPKKFYIHASSVAVDYDYIMINAHDYLMPVHGIVSIRQGKHDAELNELEFRDYRRFGSRVRILGLTQPPPPPNNPSH